MKIEISKRYLKEGQNQYGLMDWLRPYCKRNKIKMEEFRKDGTWAGEFESYIRLIFKSENQLDCFVRIGNRNFSYFEFI